MRRAANLSRVLPGIVRRRHGAYLDRWYRQHEQRHNDGVNLLVVRFAEERVSVVVGWRGEINVPDVTQVRPDLLAPVEEGPFGPGAYYLEFERSAAAPREVAHKLRPYRSRTIAKSGGSTVEAVYGLRWAEGASFGSQGQRHPGAATSGSSDIRGQRHPGREPSFQAQGVQPGVDQGGEYLPQPQTAQRVHVLIPAAVLHVMLAVLNAPVVAEEPEQLLGAALARTQAGQQIPARAPHLPRGYIHRLLLYHGPLPRPRKSQIIPDIVGQQVISPNPTPFDYTRFFPKVSASGSPSSSGANPSAKAASASGWFPLIGTR